MLEFNWRLNDVLVLLYSIIKDLITLLEAENPSYFPGVLQKLLVLRKRMENELLRWESQRIQRRPITPVIPDLAARFNFEVALIH